MTATVTLAHADLELSRLGFGCASLMRITSDRARRHLLDEAFDHGIRHFDVARMYGLGAVEGEVGRFARGRRRDELTIATKFGIDPAGGLGRLARFQRPARAFMNRVPAARQAVKRRGDAMMTPRRYDLEIARRSFDTSLRELGLDYVDVLFIHDPSPGDDVRAEELLGFFEQQRAAGKLRSWGVSQDAHPGLDVASRLGPSAVLQVREHALARADREEPRVTFGVLGGPHAELSAWLQAEPAARRRWTSALGTDPCRGDTLAALLLADALDANPGGAVLFSTTKPDRVRFAARTLAEPPGAETLATFRTLLAGDPVAATA